MSSERERIRGLGEEALASLVAAAPARASEWTVRMTSGTTNAPLLAAYRFPPMSYEKYDHSHAAVMAFGLLNVRLSNTLLFATGLGTQTRVLCLDARDLPTLKLLIDDLAPDTFSGITSFVARAAEAVGASPFVERLQLAGERLTPVMGQLLETRFPKAKRFMFYAANEVGVVSTHGCEYLPPNQYHAAKGIHIDILNPDESGAGELLVTRAPEARGVTVEHYRIGDSGRLVARPCPCGAAVTFEHLGRLGKDYIKIAGAIVRREEFDRIAALFAGQVDDYRLLCSEVVMDGVLRGALLLQVWKQGGAKSPGDELAHAVERAVFITPTQTLAKLVESGAFVPLTVEFVATPFAEGNKDVKLFIRP